ncbi:MAG: redox-regulated ATPase YchF [Patescibacteria group bacterium]
MKLSIGIVGLPNVGKSTLFNLLTKQQVDAANYPFCTIDPNVGVVPVPDERLDQLTKLSSSKKKTPAVVEFYDIAGLVRGANKGEGLGNQFLSYIREVNVILMVLRGFSDENVVHIEGSVDPLRDLEIINTELALKDLETVEKRLRGLEKEVKSGDKGAIKDREILEKAREKLNRNEGLVELSSEPAVKNLQLLTAKKRIHLLNGKTSEVDLGGVCLVTDLAVADPATLFQLIKQSYQTLDLISFLTTGDEETRAWTVAKDTKAPDAAGVIHNDFKEKFIKAEVINWEILIKIGGWTAAKSKGLVRLEGRDYLVQDGDVMFFRHG